MITIEDAAELRLRQPHVIRLEARPPNLEGRGEVTIRRLVRNALRMRPDRIVVGEVRGAEALDMLTALSTGHEGSLCTIHAGTPAEALRRVETLALMAGLGLPHAALREQVADAFDLVVCQARGADGSRRVIEVAEVIRVAGGAGRARALRLARRPRPLAGSPERHPRGTPRRGGMTAARSCCRSVAGAVGVLGAWEALAAVERLRVAAAFGRRGRAARACCAGGSCSDRAGAAAAGARVDRRAGRRWVACRRAGRRRGRGGRRAAGGRGARALAPAAVRA